MALVWALGDVGCPSPPQLSEPSQDRAKKTPQNQARSLTHSQELSGIPVGGGMGAKTCGPEASDVKGAYIPGGTCSHTHGVSEGAFVGSN